MLMSANVMAIQVSNPFKHSLTITKKYMPKAFAAMWQSEHLLWRAQLFKAACEQNKQSLKYAINAGFPLVNQFITDQAAINSELNQIVGLSGEHALTDETAAKLLHDSNKLYYRIFSEVFAYGYIRRLQIVQHFHPDVSGDLCAHAKKIASEYVVDEVLVSPWQMTEHTEFEAWQGDLFSMTIVNKYFTSAYIARQKPFGHIVDANIYAMMQKNEQAESAFSKMIHSYEYSSLLLKEITQAYQDDKGSVLPVHRWRAEYAFDASVWASQAYTLATLSTLRQINELYPEHYQQIEKHMTSYVDLQLSSLAEANEQLNDALNKG